MGGACCSGNKDEHEQKFPPGEGKSRDQQLTEYPEFSQSVLMIEPAQDDLLTKEWHSFREQLISSGIEVESFKQTHGLPESALKPDWFTTVQCMEVPLGAYIIYPMQELDRQEERENQEVLKFLSSRYKHKIDLSHFESRGLALEGKAACVFDIRNRKIYASLSNHCSPFVLNALVDQLNEISATACWKAVTFSSFEEDGARIQYTDTVLALLKHHALVCVEAVQPEDRDQLLKELSEAESNVGGAPYEVLEISREEMRHFACNSINLRDTFGKNVLTISRRAHQALSGKTLSKLEKKYEIVVSDIGGLETVVGGGRSTRSLLALL